jgi:hypothetical protein
MGVILDGGHILMRDVRALNGFGSPLPSGERSVARSDAERRFERSCEGALLKERP